MGNSRLQKKWVNLHNNGKKTYAEILRGIRISSYKQPSLTQTKHNSTLNKSRQQSNNLPGDTSFQHEFNVQVETSPKYQLNDHNESQGEESKETTRAPHRLTKDSSLYDKEILQIIQESNSLRSKIQAIIENLKSKNKWTEHHEQWRNEITSFFLKLLDDWRELMKSKKRDIIIQLVKLEGLMDKGQIIDLSPLLDPIFLEFIPRRECLVKLPNFTITKKQQKRMSKIIHAAMGQLDQATGEQPCDN
ncbi:hypothetical protein OXYTRIMIC_534 [Oxytricha trifallax]|uniref:Uncharacterized protein n=1 Tax=Oxytricha trifallax TaxID=1172189 RepID=A0A073HWU9_9SPIT|nr:hypothetical protein OXYTRIMIC_534 [Oxytricha trifallax]